MKLQTPTNTVEMLGTTEQSSFKIKASRKAFKILSDLYSDKPLAIVREIGTNAADSHVMAGKADVPFHIHLPNSLEPWIEIRDFGTGIAHDDIYNIYTVYFSSTKDKRNDQVGCLGLGNKSGFCYTDSFTITSIFNGEKRIYNMFFSENDEPSVALMSEEITDESNGLTFQMAVKYQDFYTFADAVKRAFRFFKVKPTISGGNIVWNEDKISFSGEGWESYENMEQGKAYAIQGGVAYPIDIYKLDSKYYDMVNHGGFATYFEMGTIDFTPSREALSYDDATIKALNDKFEFISMDFTKQLSKTIEDKENLYEALKAVYTIQTKFSFLVRTIKQNDYIWNGIDVSFPVKFLRNASMNGNVNHYYRNWGRKIRVDSDISFKSTWYFDDLKRGGINRIKRWVKDTDKDAVYFDSTAYAALLAIGIPAECFLATSTLPSLARNSSGGSTATPKASTEITLYLMGGRSWKNNWIPETYDTTVSGLPKFYMVRGEGYSWDFKISHDMLNRSITDKSGLKDFISALGFNDNDICLCSKRNEAKMIAAGSINFQKYVDDNIANFGVVDVEAVLTARKYNGETYYFNRISNSIFWNELSDTNPVKEFIIKVNEINDSVAKRHAIIDYIKFDESKFTPMVFSTDCPITKIIFDKICSWDATDVLKLLIALEKKNAEMGK